MRGRRYRLYVAIQSFRDPKPLTEWAVKHRRMYVQVCKAVTGSR